MASLADLLDTATDAARMLPVTDAAVRIPDEQAAYYVGYLADHVGAETLGDLLEDREANRLHLQALRPSDRGVVEGALRTFLAAPSDIAWRWRPRSQVRPPEPPEHRGRLATWAKQKGLQDALQAPLDRLRPFLPPRLQMMFGQQAPEGRIDMLLGSTSGASPAVHRLAREAFEPIRRYLQYVALRRELDGRRETLWGRRPAEPVLRRLGARLRELLRELDEESTREPARLSGEENVSVDRDPPGVRVTFFGSGKEIEARIGFEGYEEGALSVEVSAPHDKAPTRAPELRALVEWTLDAVHDAEHPLHGALARVLARPTWTRLVEALRAPTSEVETVAERVVWRLDLSGTRPELTPAVQRRGKSGRWTKGATWRIEDLAARREILEPRDESVLDALLAAEALAASRRVGTRRAEEQRLRALRALVGHPRVLPPGSAEPLVVRRTTPTVALVGTASVRPEVRLGEVPLSLEDSEAKTVVRLDEEERIVWLADIDADTAGLLEALGTFAAQVPTEGQDALLEALVGAQPGVQLELPQRLRGESRPPAETLVLRLEGSDAGLRLQICARPVSGGGIWPAGDGPRLIVGSEGGARVHALRHLGEERRRADELLEALGPALVRESETRFRVDGLESALDILARLEDRGEGVELEWRGAGWRLGRSVGSSDLRVQVRRAGDLLGLQGVAKVDGVEVPLAVLLKAARDGARYVRIGSGRFARLADDLRRRLEVASDAVHTTKGGEVVAGVASAPELADLLEGVASPEEETQAEWRDVVERARAAAEFTPSLPADFEGELRDYQREGFEWLTRLASWGAGAVLADEMGLGKTVQTIAALLYRASEGPILVVAPTSVGQVWTGELARFAPTLRVHSYRGAKRTTLLKDLASGDVLVTSYDIVARDAEPLAEIEWGTLVLDEAQAIKNARTKRARAVGGLRAKWRLGLTGTPLENHLGELWSLFRVVSPGLLGGWERFRRSFAVPIERDGDQERQRVLASRLRPFLLRRTKAMVAKELPPRTDVLRPVELGDAERAIYDAARGEALEELIGAKRFDILSAITRLRLLSCHPRLVDARSTAPSAKMESTLELIEELRETGHRALVFSQFTKHLALLREELDLRGITHLYLDGGTSAARRASLVEQWQSGNAPLFLISLKAGGTGLNLTAADYVLHLDPWWNPAVEDQASDRAHRIGQDKPVTVVRLVSQGTIEENVVALHASKRALAESVLEGGAAAGSLSTEDLVALIE